MNILLAPSLLDQLVIHKPSQGVVRWTQAAGRHTDYSSSSLPPSTLVYTCNELDRDVGIAWLESLSLLKIRMRSKWFFAIANVNARFVSSISTTTGGSIANAIATNAPSQIPTKPELAL